MDLHRIKLEPDQFLVLWSLVGRLTLEAVGWALVNEVLLDGADLLIHKISSIRCPDDCLVLIEDNTADIRSIGCMSCPLVDLNPGDVFHTESCEASRIAFRFVNPVPS
jgi:hypothetical protein